MGNRIEVNHSVLGDTANALDNYVEIMTKYMKQSDETVERLKSKEWTSEDARAYSIKWKELSAADSSNERMKSALRNYSKKLKYAKEQYKNAQSKAINRTMFL